MITKSKNHLENLIKDGYELDFGDYVSQGFSIVNKNIGGFIGYTLIYLLTNTILRIIPTIGPIISAIIMTPLIAGFYIVANKIKNEEHHEFSDFFKGFDFFKPLVILALLSGLIMIISIIPIIATFAFLMSDIDSPFATFTTSYFFVFSLGMIPFIYIATAYGWSSMFVVFHGYSAWEAMEMSRKIITRKWFSVFLYLLIIYLILIAGVLALGVGLLYTIPFFMCANYVAFSEVTKGEVFHDVMDHLVE